MLREIIHPGLEADLAWALTQRVPVSAADPGVPQPADLSAVTRMVLRIGPSGSVADVTVDSQTDAAAITWDPAGNRVNLKLGAHIENLPAGEYPVRLVLYSPDQPRGLPWTDEIRFIARD